jgi:hypothetical protein
MTTTMYDLPIEMIYSIAGMNVSAYRAMLAVPRFARSLGPGAIVDFKIAFGYFVEIRFGQTCWYLNGVSHRRDGPAIECPDGGESWWADGKLHRQARHGEPDGPAIVYTNGDKFWFLNGVRHRDDGPAIELNNGTKEWWLIGIRQPDQ